MFQDYYVNTIAADALAPYVARSSAVMVLTKWDKQVIVFHGRGLSRYAHPANERCRYNVTTSLIGWVNT